MKNVIKVVCKMYKSAKIIEIKDDLILNILVGERSAPEEYGLWFYTDRGICRIRDLTKTDITKIIEELKLILNDKIKGS